jgi:hypothetical protein
MEDGRNIQDADRSHKTRRLGRRGMLGAVRRLVLTDWVRMLVMAEHFVGAVLAVTA